MRKLIFLIFLVGMIAALPWLDGLYAKARYLNMLAALNTQYQFKTEVIEYHVGWLQSKAKVRFTNLIPPTPANSFMLGGSASIPNEVIVDDIITHGPLIYDAEKSTIAIAIAKF